MKDSASDIKIDAYNHFIPPAYLELLKQHSKDIGIVKRMASIPVLCDLDARVELLSRWPEVRQVLTLGLPHPEALGGPEISVPAARQVNDGLAEACKRFPRKFPAFVASLPMNDVPSALEEMDRAIGKLGARGIQLGTNILGRALDDPEFFPVFERMANHHRLPVWMHPLRQQSFADYRSEPKSRYEIWQVLGWPYETSAAMARIVFCGLFDRLPDLRIITHHCGGMIPYFAGRAETLWAQLGSRTADEDYSQILARMTKPLMEYFRMFYGDTVLGGSSSALRCGLDFFGSEHVVFASDCPFDPEGGAMFIREGIRSVEDLRLTPDVARKIYYANAAGLMKLTEIK
ncbi:MAG TPA: amidohydrolase family protein [Micropepsaceae bacterium]